MDEHSRATHAHADASDDDDDASYIVKKLKVVTVTSQGHARCFVDDCAQALRSVDEIVTHMREVHKLEDEMFQTDFTNNLTTEASDEIKEERVDEEDKKDDVTVECKAEVKVEATATEEIKMAAVEEKSNESTESSNAQLSRRRPRKSTGGRRLESIVSGLSANLQLESSSTERRDDVSNNTSAQPQTAEVAAAAAVTSASPAEQLFYSSIGLSDDVTDTQSSGAKSEEDWKEWSEREGIAIDDADEDVPEAEGEGDFHCDQCDFRCTSQKSFIIHIKAEHNIEVVGMETEPIVPVEKPGRATPTHGLRLACKICPYVTNHRRNFKKHVDIHSKVDAYSGPAYKCGYCPYIAMSKGPGCNHVRSLHSDKPFKLYFVEKNGPHLTNQKEVPMNKAVGAQERAHQRQIESPIPPVLTSRHETPSTSLSWTNEMTKEESAFCDKVNNNFKHLI